MLKQFLSIMARYLRPYRKYMAWSVVLNFLSQWMNVFSFMVLIPILNILFKIDTAVYTYKPWTWETLDKDLVLNNAYAWVQELININGAFLTLVSMGLALIIITGLKTLGYFASSAVMIPLRTGVVRDIRVEVYDKVLRLPLSFFSDERKGDIIARMCRELYYQQYRHAYPPAYRHHCLLRHHAHRQLAAHRVCHCRSSLGRLDYGYGQP